MIIYDKENGWEKENQLPATQLPAVEFFHYQMEKFELRKLEQIGLRITESTATPTGTMTYPPKYSRKIGYKISARIPVSYPCKTFCDRPALYRDADGHWEASKAKRSIAATWPDEILEAYSAICMTGDAVLADQFAFEQRKGGALFYRNARTKLGSWDAHRDAGDWGKEWMNVREEITVQDLDEAVIFILSWFTFFFLRKTKQIPGRLDKVCAAAYACAELRTWQKKT